MPDLGTTREPHAPGGPVPGNGAVRGGHAAAVSTGQDMSNPNAKTRALAMAAMAAGTFAMAGCTTAPTYGTGTRSDVQLLEDFSNIASLSPGKREKVAYNPRPTLVKPAEMGMLPQPQPDVAEDNPAWPESPEERRARIRAEADANAENPNFRARVVPGSVSVKQNTSSAAVGSTAAQNTPIKKNPLRLLSAKSKKREDINARISQTPDVPSRRYLSDPPVEYQETAATAPVNDIGEAEYDKEKRRKALIKKGDKKSWRDYMPF